MRGARKGLETDGEAKDYALSQLEQLQAQVAAHIKALPLARTTALLA